MNITISKHQIGNENINSVNARDLYIDLGLDKSQWSRWSNKNIIEDSFFIRNRDYLIVDMMSSKGLPYKDFIISLDMAKHICMLARTEKAHQIREYFIECEKQSKNNILALPSNYKEALKLLLAKEEELDEAHKTKSYISDKKTATAMNTASQMRKKANKLEIELDKSKEYSTIKRMSMLTHGNKYDWRELKEVSNLLGLQPIDVFDANYGKVKSYHKDVWLEAYAIYLSEVV